MGEMKIIYKDILADDVHIATQLYLCKFNLKKKLNKQQQLNSLQN